MTVFYIELCDLSTIKGKVVDHTIEQVGQKSLLYNTLRAYNQPITMMMMTTMMMMMMLLLQMMMMMMMDDDDAAVSTDDDDDHHHAAAAAAADDDDDDDDDDEVKIEDKLLYDCFTLLQYKSTRYLKVSH